LASERQQKRNQSRPIPPLPIDSSLPSYQNRKRKLIDFAKFCDDVFANVSVMPLLIFLWVIYIVIGLYNFSVGIHNVTYSPIVILDKQIGFFRHPLYNFANYFSAAADPFYLPNGNYMEK